MGPISAMAAPHGLFDLGNIRRGRDAAAEKQTLPTRRTREN